MHINFLLFVSCAGGNFFTRALTTSTDTIPLGVGEYTEMSSLQRLEQYSYIDIPKLPVNKNDTVTWWQYELKNEWPLRRFGIEKLSKLSEKLKIIEPSHPQHFYEKIKLLGQNDSFKIFEIDHTNAEEWLLSQMIQKTGGNGHSREHNKNEIKKENAIMADISKTYNIEKINLKDIINSKESFYKEYLRICNIIQINPSDLTLDLYDQWKKTWGYVINE